MKDAVVEAFDVLVVEDNPGDAELVREALHEVAPTCRVAVAQDGVEALKQLADDERAGTLPRLILLDLNLPKLDGRAVLTEIKHDVRFSDIPVVVFSSSEADRDVSQSYRAGANCFVKKRVELDEIFQVVGAIAGFWLGVVKLPPPGAPPS